MNETPKESAEAYFKEYSKTTRIYYGHEQGANICFPEMIEFAKSYANRCVKKACKIKDEEIFAELCVITTKRGKEQSDLIESLRILYAPSPKG